MDEQLVTAMKEVNYTRYQSGQESGHYESFFQRANHPSLPLAFWIRYTIFSPDKNPERAIGEIWAVYFNGDTGNHVAVKREVPFSKCDFKTTEFFAQIDEATLQPGKLTGSAMSGGHEISWDLSFHGDVPPLFLLPLERYTGNFPKAKALVALPLAVYNGSLSIDDERIEIKDWIGSQNHNWGARHTDRYLWGQVAGFDNNPDSFLEVATARLKFGPLWTPPLSPLVLRYKGREFTLNSIPQMLRARGSFRYFVWNFRSKTKEISIDGTISAPRESFVGLNYYNPPGGSKHCLNSKIASCKLNVTYKEPGKPKLKEVLFTSHRAAFEILTDLRDHGIKIEV